MFFLPGVYNLLLVSTLLANAVAVLSEDRFLARVGWSTRADPGFGVAQDQASIKWRLVNGIAAVRYVARLPLIFVNSILIIYLLALG